MNNKLKEFYERFNINEKKLFERPMNFEIKNMTNQKLRIEILKSELNDFKILNSTLNQTLEQIRDIQENFLNRFQLEKRNTFSTNIEEEYINFLISTQNLQVLLTKQQKIFYKKRIKMIEIELSNLEKST